MFTRSEIYSYLENVHDPEVPVLSVLELGVVRDVIIIDNNSVEIKITPTYSGCPAMNTIALGIKMELISRGITNVHIHEVLSPAWTTDWMSEAGKQKLMDYGIAPPQYNINDNPENKLAVICPRCKAKNTKVLSEFGSTSCKSLMQCQECLEAFDYFKCH
jgi:ring-1,2-phenylacetyl-CoA epoxidase subunit PaaD